MLCGDNGVVSDVGPGSNVDAGVQRWLHALQKLVSEIVLAILQAIQGVGCRMMESLPCPSFLGCSVFTKENLQIFQGFPSPSERIKTLEQEKTHILARKFFGKNQPRKSKQSRKGRTGLCWWQKNNKHKTHKQFSAASCGTIVPGTNPHPSQGQTGQNGNFTVEFNRNGRFVPGTPVCPRDGSRLSQGRFLFVQNTVPPKTFMFIDFSLVRFVDPAEVGITNLHRNSQRNFQSLAGEKRVYTTTMAPLLSRSLAQPRGHKAKQAMVCTIFLGKQAKRVYTIGPEREWYTP